MRGRGYFVLGMLDKSTALAVNQHCFTLQKRKKTRDGGESFVNEYFYSELLDAIRGYVRHKIRVSKEFRKTPASIESLIAAIQQLESTVKDIGTRLSDNFEERLNDPVEAHVIGIRSLRNARKE